MRTILLITKREYLTQVRKKSFIILTLLAPILLIGFGAVLAFLMKGNEDKRTVIIGDETGKFAPFLTSSDNIKYQIISYDKAKKTAENLKTLNDDTAVLLIPNVANLENLQKQTVLFSNKKSGLELTDKIEDDLSQGLRKIKLKELNIPETQWNNLGQRFTFIKKNVADDKEEDSKEMGVKTGFSMLLMYVVFMFILMYGVRVMRSVLEEKNNRVVEIIISSVKPFQLMMGKILGVTFVALTQFIVWISMTAVGSYLLSKYASQKPGITPNNTNANLASESKPIQMIGEFAKALWDMNIPLVITVFILFFLMGYLFYSAMYAAIGSAVDNETETQQFSLFAILPLMLGMYGSISLAQNPDSNFSFWLSIIPFTSPVAMVARIPFGVPLWQIALSFTLLAVTTFFMVKLAGKIYKVGIMNHGNKASLAQMWKWMRA